MKSETGLKREIQIVMVYLVVFVIFALFAIGAVIAMNRVIHYYTDRETNVYATNLQLDLNEQMEKMEIGLDDPEVRHLLEICDNLHDLDIVITDRRGIVQVSSERELKVGEPLFAQNSVFSSAEPFLMRDETLHFIDGAWVPDSSLLDVTYCTTRPVIGTDSRMVVLARNSRLMSGLGKAMIIFFAGFAALFILTIILLNRILFGYRHRIIELATVDELTGLANRKSFLRQYDERCHRGLPEGSMLFMLDVDKFKEINDVYGHLGGDQALAFIAQRIQSLMNQNCIAGRWGGDEFIGIYTNGRTGAREKLNLLLTEVRNTPLILESGEEVHLTISIGAVPLVAGQNLNKSIELADEALYRSKEAGRNCLTIGGIPDEQT